MMKHEFEQLAGYKVSDNDYNNIIEPMYMATDLDKIEFVKTLDRTRFELIKEPTQEEIELAERLIQHITECKEIIKYNNSTINRYKAYLIGETDKGYIAHYKRQIKRLKEDNSILRAKINAYKWVLGI